MIRNLLSLTASAAVLAVAAGAAQASSFAIRSGQGAEGLGMAYAGAASGGIGLAAMAWNPAAITMFAGRQSNWNATYLNAYAKYGLLAPGTAGDPRTAILNTNNLGLNGAFIPASYNSWQITDRLFLGLTNTAPYGLRSKPGFSQVGQFYGRSATIRSVNISPTVGYKINDWISVGAAIQMQYMQVDQKQALSSNLGAPGVQIRGDSYDFGYRLGVTLAPFAGTTIGIAYRSAITQTISGWAASQGPAALNAGTRFSRIKLDLPTPASVVAGISHTINDRWQAHLGLEWTQWSALKSVPVTNSNGTPLLVTTGAGTRAAVIRFNYKDSWYLSGGIEYKYSQALTLRAGVAYEWSAVTDRSRTILISDNDRLWLSTGLSYKATDKLTFDLGYTYIHVNTAKVTYNGTTPSPGGRTFTAQAEPRIHVVSAGLTYRWDDPTVAQSVVSRSAPISVRY